MSSLVLVLEMFQYIVLILGLTESIISVCHMRTRVVPMTVKEALMRLRNKIKKQPKIYTKE